MSKIGNWNRCQILLFFCNSFQWVRNMKNILDVYCCSSIFHVVWARWSSIDTVEQCAVLSFNTNQDNSVPPVKKVRIHPPSASRILLPDGRHLAFHELGVPAGRARYSLIAPHSFLSSRLAGRKLHSSVLWGSGILLLLMRDLGESWAEVLLIS